MRTGVEFTEIPRDECLALVASRSVGRLAVISKGRPLIYPVNYVLDGDVVVFRTDAGSKLAGAPLRKIAFEVDEVDEDEGTGWSVLIQGYAYEITRGVDVRSRARRALPLEPFAPGERAHWIEITADSITGRRIAFPS